MKIAITIPDDLFEQAEIAAKELSLSRSELYAKAVEAFITARSPTETTAKLNDACVRESSSLDPVLAIMQWSSLPPESW
ncbi:MAG: hypothetical protein SGJ19_23465 [Planctomycetia bacterium]|nr:hypothetical protein [Planctomycetia bacterium]